MIQYSYENKKTDSHPTFIGRCYRSLLFLTTIEAWIFWLAALILVGSLWWFKKAIQGQKTEMEEK